MSLMANRFGRVAETVTERTAALLRAPTSVVDSRGLVIASSDTNLVGCPFDMAHRAAEFEFLRIPLRLDGQSGMVVVAEPPPE